MAHDGPDSVAIERLEEIACEASNIACTAERAIRDIKESRESAPRPPPTALYNPIEEMDALLGFSIGGPQMWHDRLDRIRELAKLEPTR